MKKTLLIPFYSFILFLSAFTANASAMTAVRAAELSRDITVDDILKPIIQFFQALLNFILSPFIAIRTVFNTWSRNLYDAVGVWAPLVAVLIVGLSLFLTYLFLKFRRMVPMG